MLDSLKLNLHSTNICSWIITIYLCEIKLNNIGPKETSAQCQAYGCFDGGDSGVWGRERMSWNCVERAWQAHANNT